MTKFKTYNKLPSFLFDLVLYLCIAEAFAWATAHFVRPCLTDAFPTLMHSLTKTSESFNVDILWASLAIIAAIAALALAWKSQLSFHNGAWSGEKPSANRSYGTSRILSAPSDLKRAFNVWHEGQSAKPGLVVGGIGKSRNRLLVDDIIHALVLGGSGSGKTTSCLLPTIGNLIDSGMSSIILDPKGECYAITGSYAAKHGYKVICIDFSSSETSDGWLPLQPAIDCARGLNGRSIAELPGEVRILADTLIPERREASSIWTQAARILFSGLAAFVIESEDIPTESKNLSTIAALAAMEQETLLDIVKKLPSTSSARLSLEAVANAPAETYGGFRINLNTILNVYADPSISGMLAHSSFCVEDFLEEKVVVYVRFNSSTQAYDALVAAFISQAMDGLRRLAENRCGGTLPRPVYWLLEEFPQIPKIPGLQKHLSIIRGLGMKVILVAQARGQVEATYREDAEAIFNNIDTTLFLAANDVKTCKYYSDLLGTYTVETKSYSQSKGANSGSSGQTVSQHEARLMRPEDLAKWNWKAGHLAIKDGQAYACSSLPISKTFIGSAFGIEGKEPDAEKRSQMKPARPIVNPKPAPAWHWGERVDEAVLEEIATAIEATSDPRFM